MIKIEKLEDGEFYWVVWHGELDIVQYDKSDKSCFVFGNENTVSAKNIAFICKIEKPKI